MKECRETFHEAENADGEHGPGGKHGPQDQAAVPVVHLHAVPQDHVPQDFGELGMSQREGPEPQVGGRVGDRAQGELDCVDA